MSKKKLKRKPTPLEMEMDKHGFIYKINGDYFENAGGEKAEIMYVEDVSNIALGYKNIATNDIMLFEHVIKNKFI